MSEGDRRRNASYMKEFIPGMVLYVASIGVVTSVIGDDPSAVDRLISLLPLLPGLWVARAVVRMIKRSDEMTRELHYQSMTTGFGAAMVAAMATGLVAIPGETELFGRLAPWLIFAAGMLAWSVSAGILATRQT